MKPNYTVIWWEDVLNELTKISIAIKKSAAVV
jgi:hypothetical protein